MPRVRVPSLTPLELRECREAFDVMTEGRDAMTASQLRDCLKALALPVTKQEAHALLYARDFADNGAIGFGDFKEIYAAQAMRQRTDATLLQEAMRALDPEATGSIDIHALSNHDTQAEEEDDEEPLDTAELLRRLHEDETEDDSRRHEIACSSLAAFLRIVSESVA